MYYVYIIKNENDDIYIGYSQDLRRRLREHNEGKNRSTKNHVWEVVYYEAYKNMQDAKEREERLKLHGQAKAQLKRRIFRSLHDQS